MRKAQQREERKGKSEFAAWTRVCRHFFPNLPRWLNSMADPRNQSYITYTQAVLVMMCIMKNISGIVTMRGMNSSFNEDAAIENLAYLSGEEHLEDMPDWQTANNYLERLNISELEKVRKGMMMRLLRGHQFDRYKFGGCWKVIIDGTGIAYFRERHCEHDLVEKRTDPETGKETLLYFHKVLEAKIVLAPNLVISIGTEFIENENESVSKQDCEMNAAKRLLGRIREEHPRLPICILADGLYATMPFMELCAGNGWHYILNLKDGMQKTLAGDFRILVETEGYQKKVDGLCGIEQGNGAFRNGMDKISGKAQKCNIFEYRHKVVNRKGEISELRFVWVTDLKITKENLECFILTGRERWKIENEGFNNQKNGIYKIEHLCSRHQNGMKAHYLITQIADMIMQLYLAFGVILSCIKRSIKSISRCIGEYFWRTPLTGEEKRVIEERTALRLKTE